MIRNPVLPGSHPDPSIVRVGDDYYLATSTFEWYPGVTVHHSRDLVHWRPLGGILTERRLLDLSGVPDSGGIWAPDLSFHDGRFHLVYGVCDNYGQETLDIATWLTTAPSIDGPWSDPVPLPGPGFDAALFHDDGRSWLLTMVHDSRPGPAQGFAGIEIRPLPRDGEAGAAALILGNRFVTEGPHLYRRDGWYYLMVAEGGTGHEHGVSVLRSRSLTGPYEDDPAGPMMTTRHLPDHPLQKAGHGCLVETPEGQWYMAYLMARPLTTRGACVLGRETAIQQVDWVDGWPRVPGGVPAAAVPAPLGAPSSPPRAEPEPGFWSTLRRPASDDWMVADGDRLRLRGGQSPHGRRTPSLAARRAVSLSSELTATVAFQPWTIHQWAGLTAYYNSRNWHYLALTIDGLVLTTCDRGRRTAHPPVPVPSSVRLRVALDGAIVRFSYDVDDGDGWRELPPCDAAIVSDEHADHFADGRIETMGFTGLLMGLWVQDLADEGAWAEFETIAWRDEVARS